MTRAELQKQIHGLLQTVVFLRDESQNLREQLRDGDIKVGRKLNMSADYLELASRLSAEIEKKLQELSTVVESQESPDGEFRFQDDYGTFDSRLNEFLGPGGSKQQ
ncbi:hypothetical protein Selin_1352 [Desulfurispirillum indicum S5]|uniref:Uncharacterized protein n=1 Tax=Desulfurispirillum indicum (strain ATCC BAA-1389 / DSM 22839 / S5) TaxID=653733 RepID=E6W5Q6_DESIS|nr:hypothetical protein [Desulfurispirillum indicum]ADU66087.1 hypothetical protein Selin_1352 [Desulfurispirillum indicum S5]